MSYQPARKLIDAGAAIALASDYNPGSSPSGNMNFVVSLSCIQMKMLPEEAINAATINGAYAMEIGNELGSITIGKKANLIFTKPIPSIDYLPYSFGQNLIEKVMVNGNFCLNNSQKNFALYVAFGFFGKMLLPGRIFQCVRNLKKCFCL